MSLKKLLPIEKYVLTTQLSADETLKRISENIQAPQKPTLLGGPIQYAKPYSGHIVGNTFTMARNIYGRNSFLPEIKGSVSGSFSQTNVQIRMRPATVVLIFMSVWLSIIGLVCVAFLVAAVLKFSQIIREGFSPFVLMPFVMFAFGCCLIYFGFKIESSQAKIFLAELLEGKEVPANE